MKALRKIYHLFDEANEVFLNVYKAPGIEGRSVTVAVPRELRTPGIVAQHLLRKGAVLPPADELDDWIMNAVLEEAPMVRLASSVGWREDHSFVGHRHIARPSGMDVQIELPKGVFDGSMGSLKVIGNLEDWQTGIQSAQYSTAIMLSLCCVFAAPLLRLLNRSSFGIVLVGPSRSGKSTAQLFAASALGYGSEEEIPALYATASGRLAKAFDFNDHLLPLNEVGTMNGAKHEVHKELRELSYRFASGQDKQRDPNWSGARPGARGTFRCISLVSSEHSPDEWAARAGEARDVGETARLITLPVLAPGCATVYDLPPDGMDHDERANWVREQFSLSRAIFPQHCGVAFRAFLEALVANRTWVIGHAEAPIAHFEGSVATTTMSLIERDIVSKFALLYAGGILAIHYNILPFEKKALGIAVARACRWALAALPDPRRDLREGLEVLKERLQGGSVIDMAHMTAKKMPMMRNADGYKTVTTPGSKYVVRSAVFANWFKTPAITRAVLEWLNEEGLLTHARPLTSRRSNEWAQTQLPWPDKSRVRSIVMYLPNSLDDLDLGT